MSDVRAGINLSHLSNVEISSTENPSYEEDKPLTTYQIMYEKFSPTEVLQSVLKHPTFYLENLRGVNIPHNLLTTIASYSIKISPGAQEGKITEIKLLYESGIGFSFFFRPRTFFVP